jgi:hypothetical protein
VTRIIGNIGDEGNAIRETGGTELYSLPFTPPEPLGGDDYNGKFVVYEWECPDGSKQRSDPCEEPEQEPDPNGTFTPNEQLMITVTVGRSDSRISCSTGAQVGSGETTGSSSVTLFAGVPYTFSGFGTSTFTKSCSDALGSAPIGITGAKIESPTNLIINIGSLSLSQLGLEVDFSQTITYSAVNLNGDLVNLQEFRN